MYRVTCILHDGTENTHRGDSLLLLLKLSKNTPGVRWVVVEVRECGSWRAAQREDLNKAMSGKLTRVSA